MSRLYVTATACTGIAIPLAILGWHWAGVPSGAAKPPPSPTLLPARQPEATAKLLPLTASPSTSTAPEKTVLPLNEQALETVQKDLAQAFAELARLRGREHALYLEGMLKGFLRLAKIQAQKSASHQLSPLELLQAQTAAYLGYAAKLPSPEDRKAALQFSIKDSSYFPSLPQAASLTFLSINGQGLTFRDDVITPDIIAILNRSFGTAPEEQGYLLSVIARRYVATDPAAAFAMGDALSDEGRVAFARAFAGDWASKDREAAWAWALRTPDPVVSAILRSAVILRQGNRDTPWALAKLDELPPGSTIRNDTTESIAVIWGQDDPAATDDWIQQLADPAEQQRARQGLNRVAKAGIGVALNFDDGVALPVVSRMFPGSPADSSGQLHAGDRIVAVATQPGQWVSLLSVDQGKAGSLITGQNNTPVWLKVQSPNDPPGSLPRIVKLQRQWLKRGG